MKLLFHSIIFFLFLGVLAAAFTFLVLAADAFSARDTSVGFLGLVCGTVFLFLAARLLLVVFL